MKKRLVNRLLSLLLIVALVIGMIPEFILTASAAEPTGNWMDVDLEALKAIVDDDTDSNGDGLADQLKRMLGLDPGSYDTNEDGLTDVFKLENGLNPLSSDTYGIGISDLVALTEGNLEVEITSNLLDTDTDADGTPNIKDTDLDNDGIPNAQDISPFDVMDTTMQQELVITLGDNPGNVSIQLTPDNLEHLVKNSQVLTWPVDKYGQMSVIEMKAGNVSVVPMLEVDMNDTIDADTMTEWGYFEYNDKLYVPLQYIYEDYQPIGLSADVFIPAKTGTANGDGTYTVDLKVKLSWLVVGQTQNITDSWSTPVPVYYNDKPIKLGDFGADDKAMQYIGSSLYVSSTGSLNLQIAWRDSDGVKVRRYMNLVYDEDRSCYNASTKYPDLLYTNFDFEDTGKTNYETYNNIYKYYQRSKLILSNADDGFDLVSYTLAGTTATFSAASPQTYPSDKKPELIKDLMSIRGGGYDAAVRSADMTVSDVDPIRMYYKTLFGSTNYGLSDYYVTSINDAAYSYDRDEDTAWLLYELNDPDTDSSSIVLKSNRPDGDAYTENTQTLLSGLAGIETAQSHSVPEMTHALSVDFCDVTGDDLSDLMFTTRDGEMYVISDVYGTDPDSYADSLISIPDDRDIDGIYAQNTLFLDFDADGGMDMVSVDAVKETNSVATDLTFQISSKFIEESAAILMRDTEAFQITGLQVEEHLGTDAEVITAHDAETTVYMTSMFINRFAQTDISMEDAIAEYEDYVLESSSVLKTRSGSYAHFNEALLSVGEILAEDIAPDSSVETPVLILTDGQSQYVDLSDLSATALSAGVLSLDLVSSEIVRSKQVMLKWVKDGEILSTDDINEMVQTGSGDIEFASDELDATAELLAEWTIGYGGVVAVGDDSIPAVSTAAYAEALSNWAALVKAKSAVSKIPMGAKLFNSAWSSATGSAIIAKPVYQAGQINSYYRSMYTYQEKMAQFSKVGNVLRGAGLVVDVAVSVYSGYLYGNSMGEVGGTSAGVIGGITYGLTVTTYNLILFALNFVPGGWLISGALFIEAVIASYIDGYDGVTSMIISAVVSAFYNMNVYEGTEIISFGQTASSYNSTKTDGLDYGYVVGGQIDDRKEFSSQIRAMQKSSPANSEEGLEKSWIYAELYNTTDESDSVDLNNRKFTTEDDISKESTYWSRYRTNRFHNTITFESCGMNIKIKTYMYTSIKLISYVGQAEYLYVPLVDDYAIEEDAEFHYLRVKDTTVETSYYDVLPDNIDDFWSEMNLITSGTPKVSNDEILAEPLYKDTNGDGVPDSVKEALGLNINSSDTDGDGLTDLAEIKLGTDPALSDTDGDGLSDGTEVNSPAPFTITTLKGSVPASAYSDPLMWDSSGDGVSDGVKREHGLNPLSRYTNGSTVYDLNRAPEIIKSLEDITAVSGETVSLNLENYFSDPDGDFLSFAVNYGEVEKSDSGSVWTYTYDTDIGGAVVQIVVTADDGRSGVIEGSFFVSDFTSAYVTLAESKGVTSFQSESVTELSKAIYAYDQSFVLTFSEDVQINASGFAATISATGDRAWLDTDTDGNALGTSASITQVASNKVEIERNAALVENAVDYVLTLPADLILDLSGNPLAEDYTLSFVTVDNVYPTVVSISSPADFENPLTLTFSEPVYISDKLQIQDDDGELYRLTITRVNDVTVRAQIPSDTLKSNSPYTIKSLGVRDENGYIGDCWSDTHTLTFTTGDVSGPTFSGAALGSGEYAYEVTQSDGKLYIPFDRTIEKGVRWNQIILTHGIFTSFEQLNPASYVGCSLDYTAEIEGNVLVLTIADYDPTVSYAALVPALAIRDEYGNAPYIPSAFGSGEDAYLRFRGTADTLVPGLVQVSGYTASEDFLNAFNMPNAGNTIEQTRLVAVYFSEVVQYTSEDWSGIKLYKLDENGNPAEEIAADNTFYDAYFDGINLTNISALGHFFFAAEPLERGASYMIEIEAGFVKSADSGTENNESVIYFSVEESDKTYGDFLGIPSEDITGSPCVGGTVKLSRGFENYFGSIGVEFEYYWVVADTEDASDGSAVLRVQSADARSYTPTEEDIGKYLFAGIIPDYDDTDLMILTALTLCSSAIGPVTAKPIDEVSIDDIEITDATNDFTEIALDFSASTNSYDLTVPVTTERIRINVSGDESMKSVYYIEGIPEPLWNSDPDRTGPDGYDIALAYGANQIEIVVESESGANSAAYTLNVTRTETDDVKISNVPPVVSYADIENSLETFASYTLSGIYGYYDEFGRAESGSTYQWYRYDSAADTSPEVIEGATGTAYTLTADDVGKYIAFGVKAKASESVFAEESLSPVYGPVYALDTDVAAISDIRISIDAIDFDLSFDAALKIYTIYYPASNDGNTAQIEVIGGDNVMINGSSATAVSVDLSEIKMVSVTADSTGSDGSTTYSLVFSDEPVVSSLEISGESTFDMDGSADQVITLDYSVRDQYDDVMDSNVRFKVSGDLAYTVQSQTVSIIVPSSTESQAIIITGSVGETEDITASFTVLLTNSQSGTTPVDDGTDDHDDASSDESAASGSNDKSDEITLTTSDNAVSITAAVTSTSDSAQIAIARKDFDKLAGHSDSPVTIATELATLIFDGVSSDYIDSTSDTGDITIEIKKADTSGLSDEDMEKIGNRPVRDITFMVGDTQISGLGGGCATISIPYTLRTGENPNAVVVYYIDDSGELMAVQGAYNEETGTVDFTVYHFSVYAVGYHMITFADVTGSDWYYDAVTFCAAREITTGLGDDLFGPENTPTRGQFIVMLMRAYGLKADEDVSDNFSDAGDTYYTGYLASAKRLGISIGIGNNMYAPEKEITRQEMLTLLYNALKVIGQLPEGNSGKTLSDFSDAGEIDTWATDAITLLVETGTVSGNNGKLTPTSTTTRAELAQVLYNLLSK